MDHTGVSIFVAIFVEVTNTDFVNLKTSLEFEVELNKKKNIKNLICNLDSQSAFRENIKRSI